MGTRTVLALPELRAKAREMRIKAAAEGLSYPVHVRPGNYDVIHEDTWTPSTLRTPVG